MDLYGNVAISQFTFDKWYLETPEFWCKDAEYVKSHPYLNHTDQEWGDINTDLFEFYKLNIEWIDFEKVFDLRGANWKQKMSTFIMWYGHGWTSPGGLWQDTSPLEHILFLGNYNVLSAHGYRWIALNHGPDRNGNYVELWYYMDPLDGPAKYYELTKIDNKEFL